MTKKIGLSIMYTPWTTDDQNITFLVNYDALLQYIETNREHYDANRIQSCDGFMWLGDDDQAMLHYYLKEKSAGDYSKNDYYSDQSDALHGNGQIYELFTMEPIKK